MIVGSLLPKGGAVLSEPFRWTAGQGIVPMGFLAGATFLVGGASGVSADGQVIVGSSGSANSTHEAFLWTQATGMIGLGDLPGAQFASVASAVSADGSVVVGTSDAAEGQQSFLWRASTGMVGLGLAPGSVSNSAEAVSGDGRVVVGVAQYFTLPEGSWQQAFRWTEQTGFQLLGDLPGGPDLSSASAVSFDGNIVLGSSWVSEATDDHGQRAFVWDALHGLRDFQNVLINEYGLGQELHEWELRIPSGISDDGLTIVGTGINPNGETEAWLVRLDRPIDVPEPAGALLLIATVTAAVLACRGRRPGFVPAFRSGPCG
ncbi:MAG TPA: hypothetical protein VEQ85_07305 [Lacipirellulaceae bacterium]|nr:hypothetical protein [Lacipirellulaceae bacterium]